MRISFLFSLLLLINLVPDSARSDGTSSTDTPELGSLERLSVQIDCAYFDNSLCRIWDEIDGVDEFNQLFKACKMEKPAIEVLRDVRCQSESRSRDYKKQSLTHLLVSERGSFATLFMDMAKQFRRAGQSAKFESILNEPDTRGLTFLDYLAETYDTNNNDTSLSTLAKGEVDRVRRYACLFGGLYAKQMQPSDCKKSNNL